MNLHSLAKWVTITHIIIYFFYKFLKFFIMKNELKKEVSELLISAIAENSVKTAFAGKTEALKYAVKNNLIENDKVSPKGYHFIKMQMTIEEAEQLMEAFAMAILPYGDSGNGEPFISFCGALAQEAKELGVDLSYGEDMFAAIVKLQALEFIEIYGDKVILNIDIDNSIELSIGDYAIIETNFEL
jgi:hypothetical protein